MTLLIGAVHCEIVIESDGERLQCCQDRMRMMWNIGAYWKIV